MGVKIGNYDFEGLYYAKSFLQDKSGVYAIKEQSGRMEIEQELREHYNPPCGER